MKNFFKIIMFCALSSLCASSTYAAAAKSLTIGILVPIELPAMTQIVNGFKETMNKESKVPVHYLVKNAQGDENIQRAILQEFNADHVNLVAPIGTAASQMTMAIIRDIPIVGIAADHLKEQAKKANNTNVTGVNSRVSPNDRMNFIHAALPNLKKLTVVYSADDRIFSQVKQFEAVAKKDHIKIQKLMVSQLSDLYTLSKNIAPDSQAIFILKDELIVSGINTLVQQAEQKKIPLIASDDGSVSKGAAFALGFSEYQTGVDAAKVALQIFNGKKAGSIPVYMMKKYFVFINPLAAKKQNINPALIVAAAKKAGYTINRL
ncbi:MAG: hypothetical protein A3E82_07195 [Gammaproteobacteria bacterium RIFCSPHIGHO2_12_FULL_38_11]|nr:MAG: hypothetical protein A3E82_07195 [Gammaproteobacteria bacterium RIFCSPHIGHO2_12_FULL_38_11]